MFLILRSFLSESWCAYIAKLTIPDTFQVCLWWYNVNFNQYKSTKGWNASIATKTIWQRSSWWWTWWVAGLDSFVWILKVIFIDRVEKKDIYTHTLSISDHGYIPYDRCKCVKHLLLPCEVVDFGLVCIWIVRKMVWIGPLSFKSSCSFFKRSSLK